MGLRKVTKKHNQQTSIALVLIFNNVNLEPVDTIPHLLIQLWIFARGKCTAGSNRISAHFDVRSFCTGE